MSLLVGLVQQVPPVPPVPEMPIPAPEVILTSGYPPPWVALPPPVIVLSMMAICAATAFVLFPLVRALARRIEGRMQDPALRHEVEELRERVRELEAGQDRYAELEERLDFAERMLAQRRENEQLPRN